MSAVLCGVPDRFCEGATVTVNARMGDSLKAHGDHASAFLCKKRYLVNVLGYTQIGGREFRPPDGGPILVLTKKCRYGARMRKGKGGGRYQPKDPHFAGTIVG